MFFYIYLNRVLDVILTPMKPRRKNVTAEDVTSSLYYLHLDLPSDQIVVKNPDEIGSMGVPMEPDRLPNLPNEFPYPTSKEQHLPIRSEPLRTGQESRTYNILRKAVPHILSPPETAIETVTLPSRPPLLRPPPSTSDNSLLPSRSPIALALTTPLIPSSPASIIRRPLGPRPLLSQTQIDRNLISSGDTTPTRPNGEWVTPEPEPLNSRTDGSQSGDILSDSERSMHDLTLSTPNMSLAGEPFSITLIRRDPTSGSQWNVGRLVSQPITNMSSPATKNTSGSQKSSSVLLHLTTPGYDQFQGGQAPEDNESGVVSQAESTVAQSGFYRQVYMECSSFWGHSFKQHLRGSSESSALSKATRARTSTDITHNQFQNADHYQSQQDRGPKPKRCFFLSPWNGHCEFSTSTTGKSLKCKHILPSNSRLPKQSPAAVSELRFNLPSFRPQPPTSPITKKKITHSAGAKLDHFRNKLSSNSSQLEIPPKLPPTSYAAMYPSDDDSESDEHLDLSLGQEKAGGGSRGKRVKLGKLIVHDEGLKMLDLVVAANMGIWWRVWEKRSVLPTAL
jgi:hypothetical protein